MSTISYNWQPLTDLHDDWEALSIPDLASLARVWAEQHDRLKESQAVQQFNERLKREWAVETGILERLYTIDRGVTQLLIEQGLDATLIPHGATDRPVSEIIPILQDHRDALEGLFAFVANRQPLSTSYIRQLHQAITRHQLETDAIDQFGNAVKRQLLRGDWKKWPNNPTRPNGLGLIHEYCPPLQVASEMQRLIDFYNIHQDVSPEVNAAWLHHRFTQIHPFQDGNGRVARALGTLVFLQAGWFPLVINRNQRSDYIGALETADDGDLAPLVDLFARNAKRSFIRALSLSEDVLRGQTTLQMVVKNFAKLYQERKSLTEDTYQPVELLADTLFQETRNFLEEVATQIQQEFAMITSAPVVHVASSSPTNEHYYSAQIISVAQQLEYWANITRRRYWVRLHLVNGQKTHLVFSFHYLGKVNRGVMVCTAFVYFPEIKPKTSLEPHAMPEFELEPPFSETHRICDEPFYFSYQDQDETHLERVKANLRK